MTDYTNWQAAKEGAKVALIGFTVGDNKLTTTGMQMLEHSGSLGVFAACTGWAAIIQKQAQLTPSAPGGYIGFQVAEMSMTTGDWKTVNPEDTDPDTAPAIWAMRFVAAHVNQDQGMCIDLFQAATPEQIAHNVNALLELCAMYIRPLLDPDGTD